MELTENQKKAIESFCETVQEFFEKLKEMVDKITEAIKKMEPRKRYKPQKFIGPKDYKPLFRRRILLPQ